MKDLNDIDKIKNQDPGMVGESIRLLPDQFRDTLKDFDNFSIPENYKNAHSIVINGMGGSNIGAYIFKAIFSNYLEKNIIIDPGYEVPKFIGKNTIYIISSYSGSTEEPLSVFKEVRKRGCKILAITSKQDSELTRLMKKYKIPGYVFDPKLNHSGQPRLGLGYSIMGIALMLNKVGAFDLDMDKMIKAIEHLDKKNKEFIPETPSEINPAKIFAQKIFNKVPLLVAAEFLAGNVHAMRNQINETSKSFAAYLYLPDLNHFAMEGLKNPAQNRKNLIFLFFNSNFYHPRIKARAKLTKEVIKKNKVEVLDYYLRKQTRLAQGMEVLLFGSWLSYYLGLLYDVNPVRIPWVDWFKDQLSEDK